MSFTLPFRQIHMDFHTSEKITPICEGFDPETFASTLERAHVNSVTCFAVCHHGMLYYDSKKFPDMVHPGLKNKNFLQQQIDTCHRHGIRVPVYITVQWNYLQSRRHPEWLCYDEHGSILDHFKSGPAETFQPGFYRTLCVNTGYRDFLKELTAEVLDTIDPVDGLFFDIVGNTNCSCPSCIAKMKEQGFDPTQKSQRIQFSQKSLNEFKAEMSALVRSKNPNASIFYNCGHIGPYVRNSLDSYSHLELESLPSGGWGYTHFSNTVRYARTLGLSLLGQTGKFHTDWGDFHSFKNKEALSYECFRMLAFNAKCLIGDQLDPDGRISPAVYDLVGSVYSEVEKKEPWCAGAVPVCDMAIFTPESYVTPIGTGAVPPSVCGASAMLEEMGCQFDIIDNLSDFTRYKLLILPDEVSVDDELKAKLQAYLAQGGKILASGLSGLERTEDGAKPEFALPELGTSYIGPAPCYPDFILPNDTLGKQLPKTEHVMYQKGQEVKPTTGKVLMDCAVPYFNRTWEHFCSHKHTPSSHEIAYPAAVGTENTVYFSHPVFSIYQERHPQWCRQVVNDALDMLLPQRILRHQGPTSLLTCVNEQQGESRYVLHLLHYIPEKRSDKLFTIENVIPVYQIPVELHLPKEIYRASVALEGPEIPVERLPGGGVRFTVPKVEGHAMIELNY